MPSFPILSRKPSYPLSPDGDPSEEALIASEMTGGYQVTRPRHTRSRRSWGVTYKGLRAADVALLRNFQRTTLAAGSLDFDWVHPLEGATYSVRLVKGVINYQAVSPMFWDVSFTLQES